MFSDTYLNLPVFVTGHTGFKGSWLTSWLLRLGASVHGYALDPQPHETLFDQLNLHSQLASDTRHDIRDRSQLHQAIDDAKPAIIFHLAAQPLVRLSFDIPIETFETNTIGTANLLESIRTINRPCVVVVVTTDKCYENREWVHSYREDDPMGGHDPYSASKGCAELVVSCYRRSYFQAEGRIRLASARAGNVIGGGDWARDRIVPDVFRAVAEGQPVMVRNKTSTRPWQHVLEPLSGYLWLAACCHAQQLSANSKLNTHASGYNFGPPLENNRTVADVVDAILAHTGGKWIDASDPHARHEASRLNLAIDKAFHQLSWQPTWDFAETIRQTSLWYTGATDDEAAQSLTQSQIVHYEQTATARRVAWAKPILHR